MDAELIAYLDERFRETSRQIQDLREETIRRFEQVDRRFEQVDRRFEQVDCRFEQVESTVRQTQVMVEGLRDEIRLIAEGVMGVDEKCESVRAEIAQDSTETRGIVQLSYEELARRARSLEEWRERKDRDPLAYIRERFALKK